VKSSQPLSACVGHREWIVELAFSPDGKLLAGGAMDLSVTLWNTSDWSKVHVIQNDTPTSGEIPHVETLLFAPDGRYLISLSNIFGVEFHSTEDWELVEFLDIDTRGEGAVSGDGRYFAVALRGGKSVRVYDLQSLEVVFQPQFEKDSRKHYGLALSPDGQFLATISTVFDTGLSTLFEIWDISGGNVVRSWTAAGYGGTHVKYSPDGTILALGEFDVVLWDPQTGEEIQLAKRILYNPGRTIAHSITALEFSPDGSLIAAGTQFNEYGAWDVNTGNMLWGRVATVISLDR